MALGLAFPSNAFSLSHVALPFPVTDPLYGSQPSAEESFGINLGTLTPRGERGVLVVPLDALVRISSNPFYPYLERRIAEGIDRPSGRFRDGPPERSGFGRPAGDPMFQDQRPRTGLQHRSGAAPIAVPEYDHPVGSVASGGNR
jgi:hypothetical protein